MPRHVVVELLVAISGCPRIEVLLDRAVLLAVAEEDVLGVAEELVVASQRRLLIVARTSRACRDRRACSGDRSALLEQQLAPRMPSSVARTRHVVLAMSSADTTCRRAMPLATLIFLQPSVRTQVFRAAGSIRLASVRDVPLLLDGEAAACDGRVLDLVSPSPPCLERSPDVSSQQAHLVVERLGVSPSACVRAVRLAATFVLSSTAWSFVCRRVMAFRGSRSVDRRLAARGADVCLVGGLGHEPHRLGGFGRTTEPAELRSPSNVNVCGLSPPLIGTFFLHHSSNWRHPPSRRRGASRASRRARRRSCRAPCRSAGGSS